MDAMFPMEEPLHECYCIEERDMLAFISVRDHA